MTNRYIDRVKRVIETFDPQRSNRYFLFGSSVRKENFNDIDLGVLGNKSSQKQLSKLRDSFYDSNIPYKVDVVDFDGADNDFKKYVLDTEPLIWIQ